MNAILATLLFVAGGFSSVWLAERLKLNLGDASKAALIVAPIGLYFLLSGKVTELDALGLKAKFDNIANTNITEAAKSGDLLVTLDEANNPNFRMESFLRACRPYYVINKDFPSDMSKFSTRQRFVEAGMSVQNSIFCGIFEAIVVVDEYYAPVGVFEETYFSDLSGTRIYYYNLTELPPGYNSNPKNDVFTEIATSQLGRVLKNPESEAKTSEASHVVVKDQQSIRETYDALLKADANVAAIVDRLGRFEGIVTRRAIETWVISRLLPDKG